MHPHIARQRGMVLLIAIIIFGLLTAIVADAYQSATVEYTASLNALASVRLDAALSSGLEVAKANLAQDAADTDIDSLAEGWRTPIQQSFDASGEANTSMSSGAVYGQNRGNSSTSGASGAAGSGGPDSVKVTIEIEDEESKWPLGLLVVGNEAEQKRRREGLAGVIAAFRDGTAGALNSAEAERYADAITAFLQRKDGEMSGPVPRAATKSDLHILNIADLALIPDLDDRVFFDEVAEDGSVIPGLTRFLTISSDLYINVNTAPLAVLRGLFRADDRQIGDDIAHERDSKSDDPTKNKKDATARLEEARKKRREQRNPSDKSSNTTDNKDDRSGGAVFEKLDDLKKIPTVVARVYSEIQRNASVTSKVFSVWITAETGAEDAKMTRQRHWIVRREGSRFVIVLGEAIDPDLRPRIRAKTEEELEAERSQHPGR